MSEGLVLLTSEEHPIYFNPSPVLEDEVRLVSKYKGKCLLESYETAEVPSVEDEGKVVRELARHVIVWDDEYNQPMTITDGLWVEGHGCVSNAVVATGCSDEDREKYREWFQANLTEEGGPVSVGFDGYTAGVMPSSEISIDRELAGSLEEAKEAVQNIFDDYFKQTR
jgi:hypothetical protein